MLVGWDGPENRGVVIRHVLDAPNGALKPEALALQERADPATLGFLGERIEPPGNKGRSGGRLFEVAENARVEHPENGGLLDHLPIVAAVQPGEDIAEDPRPFYEPAPGFSGPVGPRRRTQYRVVKAARDE